MSCDGGGDRENNGQMAVLETKQRRLFSSTVATVTFSVGECRSSLKLEEDTVR